MSTPKIESKILESQRNYLLEQAKLRLGEAATEAEISQLANEILLRYYKNLGKPLFLGRKVTYGELPFIEDYYNNNQEIEKDLEILFSELDIIATYLVDYFNYSNSEKERILAAVQDLNGTINDLQILSEDSTPNTIIINESFTNYDNMDKDLTETESQCMIHTEGAVLTLRRTGAKNRSTNAKIKHIVGNGEAGTNHLVRRIQSNSEYGNYMYISSQTPNNVETAIIDNNADTIYEFQMVNVPEKFKAEHQYYDLEWAKGEENNDLLRVRIVIKLDSEQLINWIRVNPYHAANSPGTFNVYSIRTSLDGFEYVGLYENEEYVLNQAINTTPQSYRLEDLFDGSEDFSTSKFAGQGIWSFPERNARYIEFVFEQPNSYKEMIGQDCFFIRKKDGEWFQIPKQQVPATNIKEEYGITKIQNDEELKKEMHVIEGWRYALGLRDISIMSFEFAEQSEYISKPYVIEEGIQKITLFANEKIPSSYKKTISESNDYVKYYVSFNDIDWYRISPNHHQPVNDDFPPKILSININETDLNESIQLHKSNIVLKELPKQVRLKIVMKQPSTDKTNSTYKYTTPFVENYALKIQTPLKGV